MLVERLFDNPDLVEDVDWEEVDQVLNRFGTDEFEVDAFACNDEFYDNDLRVNE